MTKASAQITFNVSAGGGGGAPTWFLNMADKTWAVVAQGAAGVAAYQKGNRISDVVPNPLPPGSTSAIVTAWTGASVSQTLKEYYLPAQGGHTDYQGNEVYVLNVQGAVPGWQRIWGPTPNSQILTTALGYNPPAFSDGDGNPRSTHGWFNVFCDNNGRLWLTMINAQPNGDWGTNTYSIDRNNTAAGWMYHGRLYPTIPGGSPGSSFGWQSGAGAFDPSTNKIWKRADFYVSAGVVSIDCAAAVAAGPQSQTTGPQVAGCTFFENHDVVGVSPVPSAITSGTVTPCWVQILPSGAINVLDLSNPAGGLLTPSSSGTALTVNGEGAVWHAASNALLIGDISLGASIKKLALSSNDPRTATYTWSTVAPAAGNTVTPTADSGYNGHFAKWQIINDMGNGQSAIVVCPSLSAVYVYKLPAAGV